MIIEKFTSRVHVSITPKMHKHLQRKRKKGYTVGGYIRIAIERALREDSQSIEEAG